MKKIAYVVLLTFLILANPSRVLAACAPFCTPASGCGTPCDTCSWCLGGPGPLPYEVSNPLLGSNLSSLSGVEFFQGLVSALVALGLVIGSLVFFFTLLLGAISWITSGGDKGKTEEARSKITNGAIGLVILFCIFAFINLIEKFFHISILQLNLSSLFI